MLIWVDTLDVILGLCSQAFSSWGALKFNTSDLIDKTNLRVPEVQLVEMVSVLCVQQDSQDD